MGEPEDRREKETQKMSKARGSEHTHNVHTHTNRSCTKRS